MGATWIKYLGLLLLISCWHATSGQDAHGVGASTLSSLARVLQLSGQETVQSHTSRSSPPFRSRNLPPPVSGTRSFPPTSQSRFAPSAPPTREESPSFNREPLPPTASKPTRFEEKSSPAETPAPSPPVATSNTEFRFGSNRPRPSSRITFIPQDRGERFSRPLLPHQAAAAAAKPLKPEKETVQTIDTALKETAQTTERALKEPVQTSERALKEPVQTSERVLKFTQPPVTTQAPANLYELVYDDYYDDEYYYDDNAQGNDSEKRGNQPEDLGPIDPPMTKGPSHTTQETTREKATTDSTPKLRFSTSSSRTTPPSRPSSGRHSLSELLASLAEKKESEREPDEAPGELESPRAGRIFSETSESPTPQPPTSAISQSPPPSTTTESRVEVRVTNTTESTFVVANVQTSRSMSTRKEGGVDDTTPVEEAEPTFSPEERTVRKEISSDPSEQPSLTALFGNIDISYNESEDETLPEDTTAKSPVDPTTKVVDITTEAGKLSTTEKADLTAFLDTIFDSIFEKPKELDPSLLPPGFTTSERSTTTTTATEEKATSLSKLLEKSTTAVSTTPTSVDNNSSGRNVSDKKATTEATSKSTLTKEEILLASLFGKADSAPIPPSSLLPAGFNFKSEKKEIPALPPKFNVPVGKSDGIPAHLLPKGFNVPMGTNDSSTTSEKHSKTAGTTESTGSTTEGEVFGTSKGPRGLIFPKRNRPAFATTQSSAAAYVEAKEPEPLRPTIVNIFDRIKTTPKLVVLAPTKPTKLWEELQAEVTSPSSTSSSTSTTTTTTTTTTTQPPRPTTPGVCGEKCRLAATLRIIDGAEWVPELANRDTKEWQTLAKSVTNELNAVYQRSRLNRWFVGVEIDAFNPGSVLVDYFLQLNDVSTDLDTDDLKQMMNGMLENSNRAEYNLGPLIVDPDYTDFVVMKERQRSVVRDDGSYLIPEWLIAVIVISLASFLFIIIFGITVLVSRARVRRRNVPLTEEVLNKLNAKQLAGVENYHHDSVYDMEAIWNEKMADADRNMKPPSSRGRGYNPNYNINIYDSWRTDWSGPYGSSATYAKRRPEANF